jgi:hypothetical protein
MCCGVLGGLVRGLSEFSGATALASSLESLGFVLQANPRLSKFRALNGILRQAEIRGCSRSQGWSVGDPELSAGVRIPSERRRAMLLMLGDIRAQPGPILSSG